jgi:hypothetical protein
VTLRRSRRHGCCGGTAFVPVAEPGAPADRERYRTVEVEAITVFLERDVETGSEGTNRGADRMLIRIENGELHDPRPRGRGSARITNDRIEKVGEIDCRALDALGVEYEAIDASPCVVVPGPRPAYSQDHQHS